MGFLDRLRDVVTGVGGAVQAPFGLAYDLIRAPFMSDEDLDGFALTLIYDRVVNRGGQLLGNLMGPEEGLGAVIGGLPQAARAPARTVINPVLEGMETIGREGIREPLSTLMILGSLADSPTYGEGWGALVDPDAWQDAHRLAQSTSIGQSVALTFGTRDILDPEEVNQFVGTDAYRVVSGTTDALMRLFMDVDILAGRSVMQARAASRFGSFTANVAPEIGGRFARYGITSRPIDAINNVFRTSYARLPESLQNLLGDQVLQQSDVGRLTRNEIAGLRVTAERLQRQAERATGAEASVLRSTAESQLARAARIEAGEVMPNASRIAGAAFERDLDAYINAPARRQALGGLWQSNRWAEVEDWMGSLAPDADTATRAGLIRDRLFPNHHSGDIISHFLAEAGSRAEREQLVRLFLGDMRALDRLMEDNYALARRAEDLLTERATILADPDVQLVRSTRTAQRGGAQGDQLSLVDFDSPVTVDVRNYRERLDRIDEELDAVVQTNVRNQRLEAAFKSLPAGPQVTAGTRVRHNIKSSTTYQTSAFGRAVRTFTDMRPHHIVDLGDTNADSMLARMMREAGWDDANIAQWRGRFMAVDLDGRRGVFDEAIEATERRMMREYGLDKDEIEEVLTHARRGREQAATLLRGSRYDGEGRARIQLHDDDGFIEYPLRVTELANAVPVTNFRLLRRELERYARLKHGEGWRATLTRANVVRPAYQMGGDVLRGIMGVWKPVVLLRPAWTMRVVLMDEQFRQMAKFGVLATILGDQGRLNDLGARLRENPVVAGALGLDDAKRARRRGRAVGGLAGVVAGGPVGAGVGGAVAGRVVSNLADVERAGYRNLTVNGYRVNSPFGNPGDAAETFRALNSSSRSIGEFLDVYENRLLAGLRKNPYEWKTHIWGQSATADAAYRSEWAYLMSRHFSQDPMTRMFLEGRTVDEVFDWMVNTREGRTHAARLPGRSASTEGKRHWVEAVADQVEAYTGGLDEVKAGVLNLADGDARKANALLDLIPDDVKAPIHGREVEQIIGRSEIQHAVNTFVDTAFEVLGGMATDTLSRNPTFQRFYFAEMQRKLAGIQPGKIAERTLRTMENDARRYALRETRNLLYDLAEESQFASMTRLLMPFFPAWQEVLTRWAGLVAENPMVAIYGRKIWEAPNKAQMVVRDDQGNEFLQFRIPEWARGLVDNSFLGSALDSQGYVRFDKGGFNLVAQGTPGFGPFVQVAVSEIVQERPDLEAAVRPIIPFGPQTGIEALFPPAMKRAMSIAEGEENRAFASARNRILITKLVQMEQGLIPRVDMDDPVARSAFIEEVNDEANKFFGLRLVAGFVSPVAPIFDSPYRPYIDVYRALRAGDHEAVREQLEDLAPGASSMFASLAAEYGDDADAIFLDLFGEEFFALTQSFTRSNDGVPPTIHGINQRGEFADLIEAHPEWGSVIVGTDGGGLAVQFSRAAYDRQLSTALRPGSSEPQRERLSAEDVTTEPTTRLGWMHYSRFMDQLETLRVSQGLPNFQVAGAAGLRNLKQLVILSLAQKYPSWYREFSVTDREKWNRTIEGAREIVADPRLSGRPDIQGLSQYLRARDAITLLLQTREAAGGAGTLSATSNMDIRALWETIIGRMVEQNPAFSDLYYRRLERDPLLVEETLESVLA